MTEKKGPYLPDGGGSEDGGDVVTAHEHDPVFGRGLHFAGRWINVRKVCRTCGADL